MYFCCFCGVMIPGLSFSSSLISAHVQFRWPSLPKAEFARIVPPAPFHMPAGLRHVFSQASSSCVYLRFPSLLIGPPPSPAHLVWSPAHACDTKGCASSQWDPPALWPGCHSACAGVTRCAVEEKALYLLCRWDTCDAHKLSWDFARSNFRSALKQTEINDWDAKCSTL